MSWRVVVISSIAKLELKLNYLVVRQHNQSQKIFIDEISTLLVENTAVSLTSALLSELVQRKIKVIFCDTKRNPQSELVAYYGSFDSSNKIKTQLSWGSEIQDLVGLQIIKAKINNQANLLKNLSLLGGESIMALCDKVAVGDPSNYEGHAARIYFNNLFGMEFSRGKDTAVNAGLNYGYTILLSRFNRCIVASGYLTQLGLFHSSNTNQFNLSSDLMEPWRPLVDELVFSIKPEQFGSKEKMCLVDLLNKKVLINDRLQTVNNAIDIFCQSVFKSLEAGDVSLISFYQNVT